MKNEFALIDKDVAALESLFFHEVNNYRNTASLQNKPWYAIALEDNESNEQQDSTNKKGIIGRMIEAIRNFITRMIAKIKAFFSRGKKIDPKAQEDFSKNYQGPSDESVNKASNKEKSNAQSTTATTEPVKTATSGIFADAGKELQKEWAESAASQLDTAAKIVTVAMLDKNFAQDIKFLGDKIYNFLTGELKVDTIDEAFRASKRLRETADDCNDIIENVKKESEEKQMALVVEVFIDPNKTKEQLLKPYHGYSKDVSRINTYLENLKKVADQLEKEDRGDETLENVKKVQKLTGDVTTYLSLFTKVALTYDKLMEVLK